MINYNDSVLALTLCPNYCLYAATVGVADGGVTDAVNTTFSLFIFFFLPIHFVFLPEVTVYG